MGLFRAMCFLAVVYSSASGSQLDVTTLQDFDVSHRVFVFKLSCYNISEYFKLAMAVGSETGTWFNTIFIDHTKGSKFVMSGSLI